MRKYFFFFLFVCIVLRCSSQTLDAEQIYKKVNNAVVTIYAYDSEKKILSQGSGVVLNDKGWIVTNYHVYNGSDKLIVKQNDKIIEFTEIIGVDADKDILILKISDKTFPSINIGNSNELNVGQKIYAIGSPMGLENTITDGIISGLRSYETNTRHYIQISAPISHGSSGGAIINSKGELIGISTLSLVEGQNLNFAIPVNEILKVYKEEGVNKTELVSTDYFYKGMKEFKANNFDKAIYYFKIYISSNNNSSVAYYDLGTAYEKIGKYDDAISCFKNAIALNPNDADNYINISTTYNDKGEYDNAMLNCKKALAIKPDAMAFTNLGVTFAFKNNFDSAIYYCKKAIEYDANYADAYGNLGASYQSIKDYDSAILNCKKAVALNPNYSFAYYNLGFAYKEKGSYDLAITYYKKSILTNPKNALAYCYLGVTYGIKGNLNETISNCNKAIEINPNLAEAYFCLGIAYGAKGDSNKAKLNTDKAYKLKPTLKSLKK